jgi:hypothetical protein
VGMWSRGEWRLGDWGDGSLGVWEVDVIGDK